MKNFFARTITGIIFVIVVVGAIYLHPLTSSILFLAIAILSYIELTRLINQDIKIIPIAEGLIVGISFYIILALIAFNIVTPFWSLYAIAVFGLIPLIDLFRFRKPRLRYNIAAWSAVIYIFLPFALTNFIINPSYQDFSHQPWILIYILIIIWANDVFAYLGGRSYGKHKLAPVISPSKTWEGTITGLIAAILAGYVISLFNTYLFSAEWMIMAFLVAVAGIFGDLGESRLKRSVQKKDSGNLLPGHGGFLDRFDAFLFAIPAAFVFIIIVTA